MYLYLLSFMVYFVRANQSDIYDTKFCSYKKEIAICSDPLLNYIPRVPKNILSFEIRNANLTNIGKFGFLNLTYNFIKNLTLSGNCIRNIHPVAFYNISYLRRLRVRNESCLDINKLKSALERMTKRHLQYLYFNYNRWHHLPHDMFDSFENSKVKHISLTDNELSFINLSLFRSFKYLKKLYLSRNSIRHIELEFLPRLKSLILDRNRLAEIPNFCAVKNRSFIPNLVELVLNQNNVGQISQHTFNCLPKLQTLKLDGIAIHKLESNVFANLKSLKRLSLNDIRNLEIIEDFAFNSTTCQKLYMANTRFNFNKEGTYNPNTIFAFCTSLTHLDLRQNNFYKVSTTLLRKIFQPLVRLQSFILASTQLLDLPRNLFTKMKNLRTLILFDNSLNNLDLGIETFGNITSLRSLDLSSNFIPVINEKSFPSTLLASLKIINLSKNRFSCTCELKWFLNWIKTTNITVAYYPFGYKCRHPVHMNGILLKDYNPTEEICNPWNPLYTMAIVLSLFGAITFGIIVVCVNCQNNIKNYVYLLRVSYNHGQGTIQIHSRENYEYHAFVVYCEADSEWVHQTFVKRMEEDEGMRLCIHHRDFDVGETITGNIDKYLQKSWKVVVVVSNEFAKSEWCQWEVDIVQERRRQYGRDVFLLIMLKNIDSKHMTPQLRTLLDSTAHLRYQTGIGEDLFWKTAIKSLQKPLGHPPVAILEHVNP